MVRSALWLDVYLLLLRGVRSKKVFGETTVLMLMTSLWGHPTRK